MYNMLKGRRLKMAHIQKGKQKKRGKDRGFKASSQRGSYPAQMKAMVD
jgi:hypothetical protein